MKVFNFSFVLAIAVLLLLGFYPAGQAVAASYKIGAQDKLRIKVYEWPALSDEVVVNEEGYISLPIVGSIQAAGQSTSDLAKQIASALRERVTLPEMPQAIVEVTQFRPFYIVGEVQRPGEYPYRPGMTVLMALSIAGGRYRPPELPQRAERDFIQSRSNLEAAIAKRREVRVRLARVRAELEGKDSFAIQQGPTDGDESPEIIRQERAIIQARISAYQNQVAGLRRQIEIGTEEATLLRARLQSAVKQQLSVERELASLKGLSDRGLLLAPRQTTLERLSAQIEGDQRDIDARIAQVRQSMSQTQTAIVKLTDERQQQLELEAQTASLQLEDLDKQIAMHRQLLMEAESFLGGSGLSNTGRTVRLEYRITRIEGGLSRELNAQGHDRVEPADVINVDQYIADDPLASGMVTGTARRTQ